MKIFDYLKSTMRVATAIFLSVCALALVVGVGFGAYNYWEKSKAKEYEPAKVWVADAKILQFSLVARTKLVDGRFFIKVGTDAYPQYLQDPRLSAKNADREIILNFVDKDEFKVFSKSIALKNLSTTVDDAGKPIGLAFEAEEYMSVPTYASIAKLTVEWTIDTVVSPAAAMAAAPADEKVLDHCAPTLSKAERLRRLALHGEVRQVGEGSYAVGFRQLIFFTGDNSLLSCT